MVARKKTDQRETARDQEAQAGASENLAEAAPLAEEPEMTEPTQSEADVAQEINDSELLEAERVIEELHAKLAELEDRHLRLAAEFDNFRKRTVRERSQQEIRAQAGLAKQILESLDDLARVSELGSVEHDAGAILEGVQLVEAKLRRTLEQLGLKPIEAVGQLFDPQLHEAMVTVPTDDPEEHEVVSQELTKGYLFKDSLLRPALVEVKLYQPESAVDGGETGDGS